MIIEGRDQTRNMTVKSSRMRTELIGKEESMLNY